MTDTVYIVEDESIGNLTAHATTTLALTYLEAQLCDGRRLAIEEVTEAVEQLKEGKPWSIYDAGAYVNIHVLKVEND